MDASGDAVIIFPIPPPAAREYRAQLFDRNSTALFIWKTYRVSGDVEPISRQK
jgi:hypothetical protein